jgi:hypothetical protein
MRALPPSNLVISQRGEFFGSPAFGGTQGHKINFSYPPDEIQLMSAEEFVSIDGYVRLITFFSGELNLTACSALVNTGSVNSYRGRKHKASKRIGSKP